MAANPIRVCIERPRPSNLRTSEAMAAERLDLWSPGSKIRIAFRGGKIADRRAVMLAASIWMEHANIKIVQVTRGNSELRCTFVPGSSWSLVGKDCLLAFPGDATLNMGWPDDPARDLHELGHALGLIHEHQSPAEVIPWNKEAAYAYYGASPNYWTRAEVDEQVFAKFSGATVTNTAWDRSSIMEYPIPPQLVSDPAFAVDWNQKLSPWDISFIQKLYPRSS